MFPNIHRDKLLHLALGAIAVACALAALTIHAHLGLGPTLAFTTTAVGILYEAQQRFRNEGQVEALDALATAAPGWIAWPLLELF